MLKDRRVWIAAASRCSPAGRWARRSSAPQRQPLAISEVLRLLHGGAVHELIDLDLKSPEYRSTVLTQQDFGTLNPGYVPARSDAGR